ncbi:MAG: hypothetical protein U5L96_17695 [Owenweeksia sp.]|nr:hypothetical protein [Owenweeksia sp.]
MEETSKELSLERHEVRQLTGQVSHWETEHKNLVQRLKEQKAEVVELNSHFKKEFKNLANEILEEKSEKFTTQNKENLGQLLNPLRDRILEFQKKVRGYRTRLVKNETPL